MEVFVEVTQLVRDVAQIVVFMPQITEDIIKVIQLVRDAGEQQLSLPTVEVPQIQFLAGVCGHSVWQQRQVRTVQTVQLGLCSSL